MAKRRKRRRISTALNDERAGNLIGGMYSLISDISTEELFDSDLQRRAVYFANKDKLTDRVLDENGGGSRPEAFWQYETDLESKEETDRHEYLINNNLLFDDELAAIIAKYLFILEPYKSVLKHNRDHDKYNQFERQANLYGGAALEAWQEFIKGLEAKQ